jgi:transcriptional regulator NrdR family protein
LVGALNCPDCGTWAIVKETRKRPDKTMRRRYECANLHRFTTIELTQATLNQLKQSTMKTNLETETRDTVDTATAAQYLNYSRQTLLRWACEKKGPLQPLRIKGARKLQWRVADIQKLIGGV